MKITTFAVTGSPLSSTDGNGRGLHSGAGSERQPERQPELQPGPETESQSVPRVSLRAGPKTGPAFGTGPDHRPEPGATPLHGGGVDAAASRYGGSARDWLDLSTGINPRSYPLPELPAHLWHRLPDRRAVGTLDAAARRCWRVPDGAGVLAAPGTSALIARLPFVLGQATPQRSVTIAGPTYGEHAAAFRAHGWTESGPQSGPTAGGGAVVVAVNPNNPDGRMWTAADLPGGGLRIIDESFCDTRPDDSLMALAAQPGVVILKGLGKFWGLGGLRLGFAIGDPSLVAALETALGPWPVSGPALAIGATALTDAGWAGVARARLKRDADRLDALMQGHGLDLVGGTSLFRLFDVADAMALHVRLAQAHILTRVFSGRPRWIRLGLPGTEADWDRLQAAL